MKRRFHLPSTITRAHEAEPVWLGPSFVADPTTGLIAAQKGRAWDLLPTAQKGRGQTSGSSPRDANHMVCSRLMASSASATACGHWSSVTLAKTDACRANSAAATR